MKTISCVSIFLVFCLLGQAYGAPAMDNTTETAALIACLEDINTSTSGMEMGDALLGLTNYVKENGEKIAEMYVTLGQPLVDFLLEHEGLNEHKDAIKGDCWEFMPKATQAMDKPECVRTGVMAETQFWFNPAKYSHMLVKFPRIQLFVAGLFTCGIISNSL